jgi:hypothetical protein
MYVCMYKYINTYMYLCMDGWMYSMYVSTYVHVYYIKRGNNCDLPASNCVSVSALMQLLQLCSSISVAVAALLHQLSCSCCSSAAL